MPLGNVPVVMPTEGAMVTEAAAEFEESAALTAVIVTVCCAVIEAGAVYSPALVIVPTSGETDQLTVVFVVPATEAVNCWDCDWPNTTLVGLIATEMEGFTVTVANPLTPPVCVAITLTVCVVVTDAGAV